MTTQLPSVITECDEYETLTEEDRAAFLGRLENVLALAVPLSDGPRRQEYPDFFQFAEDLELDVSHLQEISLPFGGVLSRWLVHYSWTFYASPANMRSALGPEVIHLVNANEPSTDASLETTESWLVELGKGLVTTSSGVLNASEYVSALAHHVAMDILLGRVLSACYKLRLNRLVPR